MYEFVRDLLHVFPNSFYYARKQFEVCPALIPASRRTAHNSRRTSSQELRRLT